MPLHGGDIYRNTIEMDYSVNVNPLGIPPRVERALQDAVKLCGRYPDYEARELTAAIAQWSGAAYEDILCGNGASELFMAVVQALKPVQTLIPVPSFYGYTHAAEAAGGTIRWFATNRESGFQVEESLIQALGTGIELLFLCNPNNPSGSLIELKVLRRILDVCLLKGITVVVDECFLEFTGREADCSVKGLVGIYPNLIVIRAFTKIFAIPGVRLGYLICHNREVHSRIGSRLPEWNLSVFAQAAGVAACREREYVERTAEAVRHEREELTACLQTAGITVFPSDANFLLLHTKLPLYEELLKRHILIRDCSNFRGLEKGYYRVAVRNHEDNKRLAAAVCELCSHYDGLEPRQ